MSRYDTLTMAEIQEFQKAKVLNEKIGKITPQTAVSLQALLKKNPDTFKTGVGKKLAQAAGEIKETGSCNCIYCGTNRAAEGKVLCEQHQKINFVRMAEMKKQEKTAVINTAENNSQKITAENNLQQNAAGNSPGQNVAGTDIVQQGQDKKKKFIKYVLIVAAFFLVVSFISGKKSTHFQKNDPANYIGKSFEDLQKDFPYVQQGVIEITGLDNVSIYMQDGEIYNMSIANTGVFPLADIYIGTPMETAKKMLKKNCKGKIEELPGVYEVNTKINGKKCRIRVAGTYGAVENVIVMQQP